MDLSNTTAVILAGGLGTRLRPVTADRPKVLAKVYGRLFLAYLLDQPAAAGIEELGGERQIRPFSELDESTSRA